MADIQRPPRAVYEIRLRDGTAYEAAGDIIEHGDGWFTLWADEWTAAIRVPDGDICLVRQLDRCRPIVTPNQPA